MSTDVFYVYFEDSKLTFHIFQMSSFVNKHICQYLIELHEHFEKLFEATWASQSRLKIFVGFFSPLCNGYFANILQLGVSIAFFFKRNSSEESLFYS